MTDNEIIKALECCGDADCDNCPYSGDDLLRPCNDNLVKDTINLINRQKDEIRETRRDLLNEIYALEHQLETAKSEAIKEFAERLKEKQQTFIGHDYTCKFIYLCDIDNLVKEMVGDAK